MLRCFVASADPQLANGPDDVGPVNVSPKGGVPLHNPRSQSRRLPRLHGSGNETARHCAAGGPITVMVFRSRPEDAAIVRLFGKARVASLESRRCAALACAPPELKKGPARR